MSALRMILSALLTLLMPVSSFAEAVSGAAFLKIGTGARPAAMGGAYTAMADDVDALYYNPGGLAQLNRRELGATHTEWLLGSKFDFLGYAHPTKLGTFALGVTRLSTGKQEARDANRQSSGEFGASDSAYTLSFSRGLGYGGTGVGANLKFLQSTIGSYSAQTQAVDLGARQQFSGSPLALGISLLNIGPGMKFLNQRDPLPLTLSLGAAYRLGGVLHLALDIRREINDKRTEVGIGTEYALLPSLSLRVGYASQSARTVGNGGGALASFSGLGAGLGINMRRFRADYTFTPFGQLGNVQRVSLGARF